MPAAANFGRETFTGNRKGKISVFIAVFKFVMHFCYGQTIRLYQENFSYLAITRQITPENINLLLIKTTAARSSQVTVMTSHCSQMNVK